MPELEELESLYCEMHKDAYGVKARWYRAESVEAARLDIERLQLVIQDAMVQEREFQEKAIKAFEALVQQYGFENAKRYQHQAYDTQGDDEYLCYMMGLPYHYFKEKARV